MRREAFLSLSLREQKTLDFRTVFEKSPGEGPLKAHCIRPDHQDYSPSLQIYENGAYCFGCGSHWWPDQFLAELGDRELDVARSFSKPYRRMGRRFIPMSMAETYNKWLNGHHRREWLLARGLRLGDAINPNLLGYDGSAFVIPVIEDGEVQSLRFRKDDYWDDELSEVRPKYWGMAGKNTVMLYKPVIPEWIRPITDVICLCEGELDALRLAQEGIPAWSLTNGCRSFRQEHVALFGNQRTVVVYDQDLEGRRAGARIARMLGARQVTWPEVLGKDVTEFLQRWSLPAFVNHLERASG